MAGPALKEVLLAVTTKPANAGHLFDEIAKKGYQILVEMCMMCIRFLEC